MVTALCLSMPSAYADGQGDPTEPASTGAEILQLPEKDNDKALLPAGPQLQAIMIGRDFRAAIIDGQKLKVGQQYEGATLIKITANAVLLRNADMTVTTLSVLPSGITRKR